MCDGHDARADRRAADGRRRPTTRRTRLRTGAAPLGFLLTQYTITGFDACAHVSEETRGASKAAAQGLWRSIFYSAVGGFSGAIFESALTPFFFKAVIIISTIGQFFCGMSCVTSMSRMAYAFSRDRAVPGWRLWSKVNRNGTPVNAIIGATLAGLVLTLPALYQRDRFSRARGRSAGATSCSAGSRWSRSPSSRSTSCCRSSPRVCPAIPTSAGRR
ncbi:amino acid permease [Micromonospora marina]|uniref:amino acid permease n=1 Tax=Micromonospora marina TaxID=307120 RepID=UPI003D74D4EC